MVTGYLHPDEEGVVQTIEIRHVDRLARCSCGWSGRTRGLDMETWPDLLCGVVVARFRCPRCHRWVDVETPATSGDA